MNSAASLLLQAVVWTCSAFFRTLVAWESLARGFVPLSRGNGFWVQSPSGLSFFVLFCFVLPKSLLEAGRVRLV